MIEELLHQFLFIKPWPYASKPTCKQLTKPHLKLFLAFLLLLKLREISNLSRVRLLDLKVFAQFAHGPQHRFCFPPDKKKKHSKIQLWDSSKIALHGSVVYPSEINNSRCLSLKKKKHQSTKQHIHFRLAAIFGNYLIDSLNFPQSDGAQTQGWR